MSEALFEVDEFAPTTVKVIRCAACIGSGCARCNAGRIGSSVWRGGTCLGRITSAWPAPSPS